MTDEQAKTEYYDDIAKHLTIISIDICKDNECTELDHFCESYAYFDYDESADEFTLYTVCISDYCQRSYDIAIGLPFSGDGADLLAVLRAEHLNS